MLTKYIFPANKTIYTWKL